MVITPVIIVTINNISLFSTFLHHHYRYRHLASRLGAARRNKFRFNGFVGLSLFFVSREISHSTRCSLISRRIAANLPTHLPSTYRRASRLCSCHEISSVIGRDRASSTSKFPKRSFPVTLVESLTTRWVGALQRRHRVKNARLESKRAAANPVYRLCSDK